MCLPVIAASKLWASTIVKKRGHPAPVLCNFSYSLSCMDFGNTSPLLLRVIDVWYKRARNKTGGRSTQTTFWNVLPGKPFQFQCPCNAGLPAAPRAAATARIRYTKRRLQQSVTLLLNSWSFTLLQNKNKKMEYLTTRYSFADTAFLFTTTYTVAINTRGPCWYHCTVQLQYDSYPVPCNFKQPFTALLVGSATK